MGELKLDWPVWIGVVTENLEAQRRFYREALGLRELEAGADWVQFDMGSRRLLELLAKSDLPQYSERRCQVGFAVDDIRATVEELLARGVKQVQRSRAAPDQASTGATSRTPRGTSLRWRNSSSSPSAPPNWSSGPHISPQTWKAPRPGRVTQLQAPGRVAIITASTSTAGPVGP
jgi:predicted enzyme related to lactoylglutathione lyase